jgi:acyl carrier protein
MVEPASIAENARLRGFGIDSIRVMELVLSIEEEFAIALDPEQVFGAATLRDLAAHIDDVRSMHEDAD